MPYDPKLAERVRALIADASGVAEKKMFGGIGWTIAGNMAVGAHNDGRLLVRCAKEDFDGFVAERGAEPMKQGERPMAGWLLVDGAAVSRAPALAKWVGRGRAYAESLPAKSAQAKTKTKMKKTTTKKTATTKKKAKQ